MEVGMTGDIEFFRKRFFGGFNQQDVSGYISRLAKERNEYEAEKDNAIREAKALAEEVASLRIELEEAKRAESDYRKYKEVVLASAGKFLMEIEEAFETVRTQIETLSTEVYTVLSSAGTTVASLP